MNQWRKLRAYLEHGLASIENNRAERAIKPFVISRKTDYFPTLAVVPKPVLFFIA
ncbi:IS66 family transposase [Thiopseudomonas alkaliphila]|uniref:IS66 family transposase n=1 Tax=Thiopseudomonas alkaliphila TaxID=1697053 RepID=UPI0009B9CD4B